jgi:hypothetical protein
MTAFAKAFIRITRYPYEEPYLLNLLVEASKGSICGGLEIYADAGDLADFARRLRQFPEHPADAAICDLSESSAKLILRRVQCCCAWRLTSI